MERIPICEDGLVGTLFKKGNPKSAVIVLGGASGEIKEEQAAKLAEHGFVSLALAYFGQGSLPQRLDSIPLEYFQSAISRLKKEKEIEKIALWGGSRGAELSLLLGTLFPSDIHAIAAHVPSSVVFGTLDGEEGTAWTFQGKPVLQSASVKFTPESDGETEKSAMAITPSFLSSMKTQSAFEKSAIPVEKISCPLLLISAEDDQMWPSSVFARQIVKRLKEYNSPIECSHLSYQGVGHAPGKGTVGLHPVMKRWFQYGGTKEQNAKAAEEWIEKTILFFKEKLC